MRIIKLTIKLCVFLVHILSGHYICLQVNYSFSAFVSDWFPISHNSNIDFLKFSVKNSVEIMDTILTLTRTLLEVRYRQRVLNTKVGCVFPMVVFGVRESLWYWNVSEFCLPVMDPASRMHLRCKKCNNYRQKLSDKSYLSLRSLFKIK